MSIELIVIGCSAGGFDALARILPHLSKSTPCPIAVVIHMPPDSDATFSGTLGRKCPLRVKEAEDKERMEAGTVYFAPPNYHLMVERDRTVSLSVEDPVHFSRPSIDVLFESAAASLGGNVAGIVLSGANSDGAQGLRTIVEAGGIGIVQDPGTAEYPEMPRAAVETAHPQHVLSLLEISAWLSRIGGGT